MRTASDEYDFDPYYDDLILLPKHLVENKDGDALIKVSELETAAHNLAESTNWIQMGEQIFSDVKSTWPYMIAGLLAAMILSLVWIFMMRWFAGFFAWISIIVVLALFCTGCVFSVLQYLELKNASDSKTKLVTTLNLKSNTWLFLSIFTGLLTSVLFLMILFLRKRIAIAIALLKQASRAVGKVPSSLLFPVLPFLLNIVVFCFWAAITLYIASSGKASFVIQDAPEGSAVKNGSMCNPKKYESSANENGIKCVFRSYGLKENIFTCHIYNAFLLFWGLFFAVGVSQVSLSGAFATYYWSVDKNNLPRFTVFAAFSRCCRYHLGSIAFGSLLIAFLRTLRITLEYIDYYCKKYDNKLTRFIMWFCRCYLWLLEKMLKFISKNAYVMIAIYGKSFCKSSKLAFQLLLRNILRVAVLDKVTDFLVLFGKLVIVGVCGGVAFYFFATEQNMYKSLPTLHYNVMPPFVIAIGSYFVASIFFSVYSMAVDTLFLCFLEDLERNDGTSERPYYMSKNLMKILRLKNLKDANVKPKGRSTK